MAPMIFTKAILKKQPIKVFNNGEMSRDFTYIDDVVDGIIKCCFKPATHNSHFDSLNPDPSTSFSPHRIFNIGNGKVVTLLAFIEILESEIGIKAIKDFSPMQKGDVINTAADTTLINDWVDFYSKTSLKEGIKKFVSWYKSFYS